jgi:hypothetical protein
MSRFQIANTCIWGVIILEVVNMCVFGTDGFLLMFIIVLLSGIAGDVIGNGVRKLTKR